jgi:integrase
VDKRGQPPANMPVSRRGEIRVVEAAEFAALLRATPPEYQRPLLLGYGAGLCWSEVARPHLASSRHAAGLDVELGEIRVRDVLEESRAGLVIRAYLKTASSRRTIPLAASVLAALQASLEQVPAGAAGQVVLGPEGKWLRRSNFARRVMHTAIEKAKLATPRPNSRSLSPTGARDEGLALRMRPQQV